MLEQQELPQQMNKTRNYTFIEEKLNGRKRMKTIDEEVLAGYNAGIEKGRLHRGLGLIEFERTKEILLEKLPPAPAVIYDIGGGYGEYSYWLSALGYEVYLYDIAKGNIELAKELGEEMNLILKYVEVADARNINRPDASADAILLFGPLYHIVDGEERLMCLKECFRLLKPNGLLFTANISCYSTMLKYVVAYDCKPILDNEDFFDMLENTVRTGIHTKKPMGLAYFHKPLEAKKEIESAGFVDVDLRGVIGPCWLIRNLEEAWKDERKRENIMKVVRLLEKEESIWGVSTHFLSISRKKMRVIEI